jgi:small-conductance mechanosensitive channel
MRKQDRKGSTERFQMVTTAPKWNSRVLVNGQPGTVEDPGFVNATVRMDDGTTVTVPHGEVTPIN